MTTTTLTPFDTKDSSKVGRRLYRKQVLPKGTINYKGQKITFDENFLRDLAEAHTKGAYDQVPFVFADPDNRHNMDPERFRGEVVGLELADDGLDAIIGVTRKGAKVLEQNPKLGVSARIVEGLAKADGRQFKRAIQHVLATMDPRVTGMRGWQAVDLAVYTGPDDQVVDLTAATYEESTVTVRGKQKRGTVAGDPIANIDLSTLTDDEFQRLLDLAVDPDPTNPDPDAVPDAAEPDPPQGEPDDEEDDDPDALPDGEEDELNPPGAAPGQAAGDGGTGTSGGNPDGTVSNDPSTVRGTSDLSNPVRRANMSQMSEARRIVASSRWREQRAEFMRAGVPVPLLDLAEPVLSSPDRVVLDLSNTDEPVDARVVIQSMLEASAGVIDLAPDLGHQIDLAEEDQTKTTDLLKVWDDQFGKI